MRHYEDDDNPHLTPEEYQELMGDWDDDMFNDDYPLDDMDWLGIMEEEENQEDADNEKEYPPSLGSRRRVRERAPGIFYWSGPKHKLPEEIFWLLCTGEMPAVNELADLQDELKCRAQHYATIYSYWNNRYKKVKETPPQVWLNWKAGKEERYNLEDLRILFREASRYYEKLAKWNWGRNDGEMVKIRDLIRYIGERVQKKDKPNEERDHDHELYMKCSLFLKKHGAVRVGFFGKLFSILRKEK